MLEVRVASKIDVRGITRDDTEKSRRLNFENIDYTLRNISKTYDSLRKKLDEVSGESSSGISSVATPIGVIHPYIGTTAPTNYLLCNGQQVSQTTYATLFQLIGTTYNTGSETVGYFRVPNLAGRFLRGVGGNAAALGGFQNDAFGAHNHLAPAHYHHVAYDVGSSTLTPLTFSNHIRESFSTGDGDAAQYTLTGTTGEPNVGQTSTVPQASTSNEGLVAETRPTNMAVNFILRAL
jgi:microcystin-dependent protein